MWNLAGLGSGPVSLSYITTFECKKSHRIGITLTVIVVKCFVEAVEVVVAALLRNLDNLMEKFFCVV